MWSDMFFRFVNGGEYYPKEKKMLEDVVKLIPENITFVYWDYYNDELNTIAPYTGRYADLFKFVQSLVSLVADKYDFGVRARAAYKAGDKAALKALTEGINGLLEKLEVFYRAFSKQWNDENKP